MKNKKLKVVIIIILALLLLVGGVYVGMNAQKWFGKGSDSSQAATDSDAKNKVNPDIDPNALDWEGEKTDAQATNSSGIAIPGYKTITLKADTTEQKVNFLNPEQNTCYFVLTLSLPDSTVIYQSKMIPPGKGIYDIELLETVSAGTYTDCILKYQCYKMNDDLTPLNSAEVKLELVFS